MKKLLILIFLLIAGFIAYKRFTQPPDPAKEREKAQKYVNAVARYWLKCAKADRLSDMQAVCEEAAKGQSAGVLEEIHDVEAQVGEDFKDFLLNTMGATGAYMALLRAEDAGVIMRLTILVKKREEKYWITSVVSE